MHGHCLLMLAQSHYPQVITTTLGHMPCMSLVVGFFASWIGKTTLCSCCILSTAELRPSCKCICFDRIPTINYVADIAYWKSIPWFLPLHLQTCTNALHQLWCKALVFEWWICVLCSNCTVYQPWYIYQSRLVKMLILAPFVLNPDDILYMYIPTLYTILHY